jgi:hypothetical protein
MQWRGRHLRAITPEKQSPEGVISVCSSLRATRDGHSADDPELTRSVDGVRAALRAQFLE